MNISLTLRIEPVNADRGEGIGAMQLEDIAGMFGSQFSINEMLMETKEAGTQAAMGGEGVVLMGISQGKLIIDILIYQRCLMEGKGERTRGGRVEDGVELSEILGGRQSSGVM